MNHFVSVILMWMWMCASVSECLPSALLIFIKINEHLRLFSHSFKTSIGRKIDILLETEYRAVSQRIWARCAVFSLFFLSSCCTFCSTIDISLELHLLQFIFLCLFISFACAYTSWDYIFVICSFLFFRFLFTPNAIPRSSSLSLSYAVVLSLNSHWFIAHDRRERNVYPRMIALNKSSHLMNNELYVCWLVPHSGLCIYWLWSEVQISTIFPCPSASIRLPTNPESSYRQYFQSD